MTDPRPTSASEPAPSSTDTIIGSPGSRWVLEGVSFLALVLGLVTLVRAWPQLPEVVPMHFDLAGNPDGWGSRKTTLILPGTSVFLYLLLTGVQRLPVRWYNYPVTLTEENRERQHRLARGLILAIKAALMGLFAHLTLGVVRTALGQADGLGPWLIVGWLALIFALVGIYFVKALRYA